jgi:hypothetical protein
MVENRIERGDKIESERRCYICSRALSTAAPLGDREQPALEASKKTRRACEPVTVPGSGGRAPLRTQFGSPSQGQMIHQPAP